MNIQYFIAVSWFFCHIVIGVINDVLAKKLGSNLPPSEIVFLRFFFSTVFLLPFLWRGDLSNLRTKLIKTHMLRGLFLFVGITIWCVCLNNVPIVMVTLMGFTIPIFFIILAYFFLEENIGIQRLIATIMGFIGVIVMINPMRADYNPFSLLLILGAILFAGLDVINKKIITKENTINMMFYSSFFTVLFSVVTLQIVGWIEPSISEIVLCSILGMGANLILYTLLKAFTLTDASSLIPIRYIEIIISGCFGYFVFHEVPKTSFYIGALIILSCSIYLIRTESKKL